ncbi:hypothetical protein D7147_31690 [Micromonospora musae]|uniref:Uncharacterized protein n=1 Tax=Micromonospora musae TaxID=1894970 RepID=A0ABX9QSR7_9ACTN|nr:hypothetical protein D7147_31690 [Micromonospora musae]
MTQPLRDLGRTGADIQAERGLRWSPHLVQHGQASSERPGVLLGQRVGDDFEDRSRTSRTEKFQVEFLSCAVPRITYPVGRMPHHLFPDLKHLGHSTGPQPREFKIPDCGQTST